VGAVERALMIALVCARHLGRYEWAGTVRIAPVLAAVTWDCLPQPTTGVPAGRVPLTVALGGAQAGRPRRGT
jgi:hypothetical protein